ncbi:MAG: hypothetical protein C0402_15495 [Thermodesulfovibrio sp.]|nr:hypothetical protein [Thermodesulfovibrio sp.]
MVIEESIVIASPLDKVWNIFTDLTCWSKWNTVLEDASSDSLRIAEGSKVRFCIRPFVIPVSVEPVIEEVVPGKKITWRGEKFGITARHEYIFGETEQGVTVVSRETFSGGLMALSGILFSYGRLKELTLKVLTDLKEMAEKPEEEGEKD